MLNAVRDFMGELAIIGVLSLLAFMFLMFLIALSVPFIAVYLALFA